jgi:hypothetical protein
MYPVAPRGGEDETDVALPAVSAATFKAGAPSDEVA